MMRTAGRIALMLSSAALIGGCGLGAGQSPGKVSLTVTDGFGKRQLGNPVQAPAPGSETAMRQLQRSHKVETKFGGGFVQSIDGIEGGSVAGRPVDWFFYVNGIESPTGAAAVSLHGGDSVWWDRRDWGAAVHVPAVVGQWPRPFVAGAKGKRIPVRLICSPDANEACSAVERRLAQVGVTAARGLPGMSGKGSGLRVVIGQWSSIKNDPVAATLQGGPAESGVYLRPAKSADSFTALDERGRSAASFGAGTGLVAASGDGQGPPTWLVTGIGPSGLKAATESLDEPHLQGHYAVLIASGGRSVALPVKPR